MRICVLGGDGYCGWATELYLSARGHEVSIADNYLRRQWDFEVGVQTLTPIQPMTERLRVWQELTGKAIDLFVGDVTNLISPVVGFSLPTMLAPCSVNHTVPF